VKAFLAAALVCLLWACVTRDPEPTSNSRGREIASAHCAACHAIAPGGDSPLAQAPPFRTLSRSYQVSDLQEALAEGISVGHPAMPAFEFAPDDVDALIAYLESIQE